MALCYCNKQGTLKLLKLSPGIIQRAIISPKSRAASQSRPLRADSKVHVNHRSHEVNLRSFLSAYKSVDNSVNSVADIATARKLDWMKISDPFFVSLVQSWEDEQSKLKEKLIVQDTEKWAKAINGDEEKGIKGIQHIGGVDVSFVKNDPYMACAAYVILRYPSLDLVYKDIKTFELTIPYICGFLAFREITPYQELIKDQQKQHPEFGPDVIMVDGNGVLHSKAFGMACHLGVLVDIPCIGVAKNLLMINDIRMVDTLKPQMRNLKKSGETVPLVGLSGTVHGMALKTTDCTREIYVSAGHRVSLETAVNVVSRCCKYRIPEPIRHADHISRVHLRNICPSSSENKTNGKGAVRWWKWIQQYTSRQLYKDTRTLVKKCSGILLSKYYRLRKDKGLEKQNDS